MSIELCHKFSDCDKMLIEVNGKLGTMNYCDYWFSNDIYLWVFDEDKEWKLHEILHFPLEKEPNESYLYMFTIRKYGTEEIVFANITSKSVENVMVFHCYDIKNKSWRYFEVQEFPGHIAY